MPVCITSEKGLQLGHASVSGFEEDKIFGGFRQISYMLLISSTLLQLSTGMRYFGV